MLWHHQIGDVQACQDRLVCHKPTRYPSRLQVAALLIAAWRLSTGCCQLPISAAPQVALWSACAPILRCGCTSSETLQLGCSNAHAKCSACISWGTLCVLVTVHCTWQPPMVCVTENTVCQSTNIPTPTAHVIKPHQESFWECLGSTHRRTAYNCFALPKLQLIRPAEQHTPHHHHSRERRHPQTLTGCTPTPTELECLASAAQPTCAQHLSSCRLQCGAAPPSSADLM